MTRTQLYLPETHYEELKKLAAASGRTFADLTREFLEEKLREIKMTKVELPPKNPVAQMLKSLKDIENWKEKKIITDGSINHDKYLY